MDIYAKGRCFLSVRILEYRVGIDGISPTTEQFGGSQGDKSATRIDFVLLDKLLELVNKDGVSYRFDGYDAEGNVLRGEPVPLNSDTLSYLLPKPITKYGGRICVYLVITETADGETEMELYNFPARLRLNAIPTGKEIGDDGSDSYSTLFLKVKKYAEKAIAKVAELFGDNVFIFDGGNACDDNVPPFKIITNEAHNPEDEDAEKIRLSKLPITSGGVFNLLNALYPVGSVITFHDDTDHTDHLGLKWERFAQGRTLVGCGTYTDINKEKRMFGVGDEDGGEYKHKLTVDEIPSHNHDKLHIWDKEHTVTYGNAKIESFGQAAAICLDGNDAIYTSDSGGDEPHNNMPPYIVTSFWKRIK